MKKLISYLLPAFIGLLLHGHVYAQPNPNADPGLTDVTTVPSALLGPNAVALTTITYSNIGSNPIPAGAVKISLSLNQYLHYLNPVVITGFMVTYSDPTTVILTNTAVIPAFSAGFVSVRTAAFQTTGTTAIPGLYQEKPYTANISRTTPIQAGNTDPNNDNVSANIRVGEILQPSPSPPLPVSLLSFTAKPVNCSAQVDWKAAGEDDLQYYELESSNDGILFGTVQKLQGKGGTDNQYSLTAGITGKKAWFRLAIVQKDGSRKYSAIVQVQSACKEAPLFSAYPNPVKKGGTVTLQSSVAGSVGYKISDAVGKLVETGTFTGRKTVAKALTGGTYFIEVGAGTDSQKIKLIVQ